jgi:hypothetical protein
VGVESLVGNGRPASGQRPTPTAAQRAAVVGLVQLLTSIGVAPSLANFSGIEVLMNAAIVAAVSLLGSIAFSGGRLAGVRFVAAVLIETIQVVLPAGPVGVLR